MTQFILVFAVQVYRRLISPAKTVFFGPLGRCRFTPSCSQYALESIQHHGARRGSWLALRRICRCHPWGGCGHDPVPPANLNSQNSNLKMNGASAAEPPARSWSADNLWLRRTGD